MNEALNIPEDLRPAFMQMMNSVSEVYREDTQFQRSILLYLKLGGERLARQRIDVVTISFCEEFKLVKKRPDDVTETEETAEKGEAEKGETENDEAEKGEAEKDEAEKDETENGEAEKGEAEKDETQAGDGNVLNPPDADEASH